MKSIKTTLLIAFAIAGFAITTPLLLSPDAFAAGPADVAKGGVTEVAGNNNGIKLEDGVKTVVNTLLFLLGAIAVIMIIIGGIRYTTSNGNASATSGAKDTILYAVIGLVVAILAYAIVNFVIGAFIKS